MPNTTPKQDKSNYIFQRNVAIIGIVLFLGKLLAWKLTNSDAIFSDAMESIVNIIAAFLGLYSLHLANKPKDEDHPYGHGKVEFVTSGIEGALIIFAGIMIIIQSADSLLNGNKLHELDYGIFIIAATAIVNYILGIISFKKGEKDNSVVLQSSGKHLQSDTYTTLGVVLSLVLVYFTKWHWLDAVIAAFFGTYIIFIGYKIIRKSLSGIMDEADMEMMARLATFLNNNRRNTWIDLHNVRIQKHGSKLHLDAHLTLPFYFELREAHAEMEEMIKAIVKNTDRNIEFNLHLDDCKTFSCEICQISDCPVRSRDFKKKIDWTAENISQPDKHQLENTLG
jgi:cation diffusion facilitator family transporter